MSFRALVVGLGVQGHKRRRFAGDDYAGCVDPVHEEADWKDIRDVAPFHGSDRPVWRISTKPTAAAEIAEGLAATLGAEAFFDWGGGLIWMQTPDATSEIAQMIRAEIAPHGGHATLIRGTAQQRAALDVFQPEAPRLARISQQLRAQFDPAGVLNPGLMAA